MAMTTMHRIDPFTPSAPDDPALGERARRDGYLFLPGLLPSDEVRDLRGAILDCCAVEGLLDPDRPRGEGHPAPDRDALVEHDGAGWRRLYRRIQGLRSFHAFNRHPTLLATVGRVTGTPVLAHPRAIARVMWPGTVRFSTPPHQDHFYIGGTENTWTAWIPLGDCPVELGGLAVVPGSHRLGRLPVHRAEGAGGHGVDTGEASWVGGDFACGDVLLMHSLCVHQGRDNRSDRLRLSVDFRYQHAEAAIDPASLKPHMQWWSWDELTADWPQSDPLRTELRAIGNQSN